MPPLVINPKTVLLFLGLYMAAILSGFIPALINQAVIDYCDTGLFLGLMCIGTGVALFIPRAINKRSLIIVLLLNIIAPFLVLLLPHWSLVLLMSPLLGIMIGFLLKETGSTFEFRHDNWILLGISISFIFRLLALYTNSIPVEVATKKPIQTFDTYLFIQLAIVSVLLLFIVLIQPISKETSIAIKGEKLPMSVLSLLPSLTIAGIFVVEFVYISWSLVFSSQGEDVLQILTVFAVCITIFLTNKLLTSKLNKKIPLLWQLLVSVLLFISCGLFFTISFPLFFIIGFSSSVVVLHTSMQRLYPVRLPYTQVSVVLFILAILMVGSGYYCQNHMEFITSIGMPKEVLSLSIHQALLQELTIVCGVITIFVGILFLNRRKLS